MKLINMGILRKDRKNGLLALLLDGQLAQMN
jgi:hypothetical protein